MCHSDLQVNIKVCWVLNYLFSIFNILPNTMNTISIVLEQNKNRPKLKSRPITTVFSNHWLHFYMTQNCECRVARCATRIAGTYVNCEQGFRSLYYSTCIFKCTEIFFSLLGTTSVAARSGLLNTTRTAAVRCAAIPAQDGDLSRGWAAQICPSCCLSPSQGLPGNVHIHVHTCICHSAYIYMCECMFVPITCL